MSSLNEMSLMDSARKFYQDQKFKRSMLMLEEVINLNPNNSEAYFLIGNIFHIQGNLGKAVKAFNKVLELDPNNTDASISLSVILNDIGRYEDAKQIFDKANEQVKNEPDGIKDPHINRKFSQKHFELAELYFSYNRYEEALFEYNKVTSLDASNFEARIKIAKVYSKKGYLAKAIEELRALKSESPTYIPARVALGLLFYGQGNVVEAHNEWQQALMKEPENQELKMYLSLSKDASETVLSI